MRRYAFSTESAEDLDAWRARHEAAEAEYWPDGHLERVRQYCPDPEGTTLKITWPPAAVTGDKRSVERPKAWLAA